MDNNVIDICYKKYNKEITDSWNELADKFGFLNGESLRSWFKRYRQSLEVKETESAESTQPEQTQESEPSDTNEFLAKKIELDTKIQQFRDERNYLNKVKRPVSRTDAMLEVIREVTSPLPTQTPYIFIKPSKNKRKAVILSSDAQVGEMVKYTDTAGFNKYNFDVFKKRQQQYLNEVVADCQELGIDDVFVAFLGDDVEGTGNIYKRQKFYLESHIVKQIFDVSESNAWFLDSLNQNGIKHIDTMAVCGNHGMTGYDNHEMANFEVLAFDRTKLLLRDNKNINYQYSNTFMEVANILGYDFLMVHGEGMNKNTLENSFYRYAYMYQQKGKSLYSLMCGHFHTPLTFDIMTTAGDIIVNGNIVGTNPLGVKNLQADNKASQVYFVVEAGKGITYKRKVVLD
jgi:transposase-like protein